MEILGARLRGNTSNSFDSIQESRLRVSCWRVELFPFAINKAGETFSEVSFGELKRMIANGYRGESVLDSLKSQHRFR